MSGPAPGDGQGRDRVYLGWQYALLRPDPGPPPRRPVPPEAEQVSPDWVAAQRREEGLLDPPRCVQAGMRGPLYGPGDYEVSRQLGMTILPWLELRALGPAAYGELVRLTGATAN